MLIFCSCFPLPSPHQYLHRYLLFLFKTLSLDIEFHRILLLFCIFLFSVSNHWVCTNRSVRMKSSKVYHIYNVIHLILFHLFRLNFERFVNIFTKFLMVVQINLEIKYEHQRTTLKTLQISNYMNARKKSRIQIGYNGSASKKCWKEQMDEKCTQKWSEQQLTSFHYYLSVVVSLCEIITSLLTMNANVC